MLSHLECSHCARIYAADQLQTVCTECGSPLLARYNLAAIRSSLNREEITLRPRGLWRWAELLPVAAADFQIELGAGDTPLLPAPRLAEQLGLSRLYIKDESKNPTGTFKARGLAVAVSRAIELGVQEFVIPTAGNAGSALAVYAARAGVAAHVFMPEHAPQVNQAEVRLSGADLHLVKGLISDAAAEARRHAAGQPEWFDVSTFKEPYRVEGKKTMGLELAEQLGWRLPDVIIYPTGGGTGLVGMWKAFAELESLGWIDSPRPRMVSVQAEGCAPVTRAFESGAEDVEAWENAATIADGLCVPRPFAGRLILQTLSASRGAAISVPDEDIRRDQDQLAHLEGIFPAPEGAATLSGLRRLVQSGWVKSEETVVLFNTGSGLKYL